VRFSLALSLTAPALAQTWSELSPEQQTALAPLKDDWNNLDPGRKQKWLEVSSRFGSMKPERQERVRERMTDWARMSPNQRTEARINYQQSRQLAPQSERAARWEAYQSLSPEERAALAARGKPSDKPPPLSPAQALRKAPVDAQAPKTNLVAPNRAAVPPPKPVAPTLVQGNPGATTSLVTATPRPPPHQQPGQPKIAATPKLVDKTTLLPKSGPQAAGTQPRPARPGGQSQPPAASKPQ
jgi:hypothetical protein